MAIQLLAENEDYLSALAEAMQGAALVDVDVVMQRLRGSGLPMPPDDEWADELVADILESNDNLWVYGPDGTILDLAALLDGRTLTHRLSQAEAEQGNLLDGADWIGYGGDHILTSGLVVGEGALERLVLEPLSPGLYPEVFRVGTEVFAELGVGEGDLVGVTFRGATARLVAVPETADGAELGRAITSQLADGDSENLDEIMASVVAGTDQLRVPLPPISEILSDAGIVEHHLVLWESAEVQEEVTITQRRRNLARTYELTAAESEAVVLALASADAFQQSPDAGDVKPAVAGALPILGDRWLTRILAEEALRGLNPAPVGLPLLCEALADAEPKLKRDQASDLAYLIGLCREFTGDALAAEEHFRKALDLDGDHFLAMSSLAGIALDRGDAELAAGLLDRADADAEHPLRMPIDVLRASDPAPQQLPGRNDPCYCGSGRKYKACHARPMLAPLPKRAWGILAKAHAWQLATLQTHLVALWEAGVPEHSGRGTASGADFAWDVLLFEGNGLLNYLTARSQLIADDERALAETWLAGRRSVYEVQGSGPGRILHLLDLVTGLPADPFAPAEFGRFAVGELLLARIASNGQRDEVHAVAQLDPEARASAIELMAGRPSGPDVLQLLDWRAVSEAEGAAGQIEGIFEVADEKALGAALDARFARLDDGVWDATDQAGEFTGSVAVLALVSGVLTVVAPDRARYDWVVAAMGALDVDLIEAVRHTVVLR